MKGGKSSFYESGSGAGVGLPVRLNESRACLTETFKRDKYDPTSNLYKHHFPPSYQRSSRQM